VSRAIVNCPPPPPQSYLSRSSLPWLANSFETIVCPSSPLSPVRSQIKIDDCHESIMPWRVARAHAHTRIFRVIQAHARRRRRRERKREKERERERERERPSREGCARVRHPRFVVLLNAREPRFAIETCHGADGWIFPRANAARREPARGLSNDSARGMI